MNQEQLGQNSKKAKYFEIVVDERYEREDEIQFILMLKLKH